MNRENIRNWRTNSLNARDSKLELLQRVRGPNAPVMFCPRCGEPIAWIEANKAREFDFKPFEGRYPSYCCACHEHFIIKSERNPYGGPTGWDARRVLAVAKRIFASLRAA